MAASDAALAASGTVALELALARVPSVVAYRLNPLTYRIVDRLTAIDHVHLCNIMAGHMIVPERLQGACRADRLAADLAGLMRTDEGAAQTAALAPWLETLQPPEGAPSEAAAKAVLETIR